MQFNNDAELDLSYIDTFVDGKEVHLTNKGFTMLDYILNFLATFAQVAIVALVAFTIMVIVAMRMDRNSAIAHRMGHRNNS